MSKKAVIRFNLIRQYCFTIIDANIILHHLFNEDEFKPKIKYFIKHNKKEKFVYSKDVKYILEGFQENRFQTCKLTELQVIFWKEPS
jgi:hypothetical protein